LEITLETIENLRDGKTRNSKEQHGWGNEITNMLGALFSREWKMQVKKREPNKSGSLILRSELWIKGPGGKRVLLRGHPNFQKLGPYHHWILSDYEDH
jgi:hypothetical protein